MLVGLQEVHLVLTPGTVQVKHSSWQLSQRFRVVFKASLELMQEDSHYFVPLE